jgi:ribose 1,5-bisphosphokinase
MTQRLIYVIGPSGAGKDTLLSRARTLLSGATNIHWAKRTITRLPDGVGETHESVSPDAFLALVKAGAFALAWQANGLHYGIRCEELAPLAQNHWVILNGSRQYLHQIAERFPGLTVIHINASAEILRQRLLERGREPAEMISERLARHITPTVPLGCTLIEIQNDTTIETASAQFTRALQARMTTPKPTS